MKPKLQLRLCHEISYSTIFVSEVKDVEVQSFVLFLNFSFCSFFPFQTCLSFICFALSLFIKTREIRDSITDANLWSDNI